MQIWLFVKRFNFQLSELAIEELSAIQDQLWIVLSPLPLGEGTGVRANAIALSPQ
jgi:hypothetical protein